MAQSSRTTDEGRSDTIETRVCRNCMTLSRRVSFLDISTDTPEDDEETWKNTPWDKQTDSVETQAQEQQPPRKRLLTKKQSTTTAKAATTCLRSSHMENSSETGPDWSSDDTALETQFEMETGREHFSENMQRHVCFCHQCGQKRAQGSS